GRQLSEDVPSDLFFVGREGEGRDPGGGLIDRELRKLMDVESRDFHVAGIRSEPRSLTGWAWYWSSVAAEQYAHVQFVALPFQVFEELLSPLHFAFSLPEHLLDRPWQVLVGEREVYPAPSHGEQHLLLPPIAAGFAPGFDRALSQGLGVVGDDEVGIVAENI